MRAREFVIEGNMSPSIFNLLVTLENLRTRTDQIRVDSLIKLVREKPGSEMFNVDLLKDALDENQTVKRMIDRIDHNEDGVPYVYLRHLTLEPDKLKIDDKSDKTSDTQSTVSSMAKRAAKKRI